MFITLKNATKKYGQGESLVYALDHANIEIGKGEICVILGLPVRVSLCCLICSLIIVKKMWDFFSVLQSDSGFNSGRKY